VYVEGTETVRLLGVLAGQISPAWVKKQEVIASSPPGQSTIQAGRRISVDSRNLYSSLLHSLATSAAKAKDNAAAHTSILPAMAPPFAAF
jgi:hypothetical protein